MSLLGALDSALSSLRYTQLSVQNASNNIANAQVEGYTRKTISAEAIVSTGGMGGVKVGSYGRLIDENLWIGYTKASADYGKTQTQIGYFDSLKTLVGLSSDSTKLADAMTKFTTSWQALTASPEDQVRQSQVIASGNELALEINRIANGIENIDRQARTETSDGVDRVNTLLENIQDLNNRIVNGNTTGRPIGDLEDKRDAAVNELSQYVSVNVIKDNLGSVRLLTPTGYTLLDAAPNKLTYDGVNIFAANGANVSGVLKGGKLEALINLRADNSPAVASADPGTEVIRKLRSQLAQVANNFLATGGTPTGFADAYDGATTAPGELAAGFFTGTGAYDIKINAALLNGTSLLKSGAAQAVTDTLNDTSRNISADGILAQSVTYTGFVSSMMAMLSASSNTVSERGDLASATYDKFKEQLASATGVNVDEELVVLQQLQNSYSASARVVSTVNDMFDTLFGILR